MSTGASWLSKVRGAFRASVTGESRRASTPVEIEALLRAGNTTSSGASVTPESAMRVSAVYACVRVLADSVAMLPMRLHADDGFSSVMSPDHRADKLILRPNEMHTPFEFKRFLMGCLVLRGNAYFFRHLRGSPREELLPLHPGRVYPARAASGSIVYNYTTDRGEQIVYPAEHILHIRALSTDGMTGLSVIGAAAEAIGLALTTEGHGGRLFSNGTNPSGVLRHPGQLSAEAAKRLRESFEERFSGRENAHKNILLEEGLTWERVGMTSEESQFIDARKFQRSEIAMFFGVPPHMIGDIERGTSWGSGIEQQGIGFVLYTLLPWLTNIEQRCARDLLSPADLAKYSYKFDVEALTRADFLTRQQGRQIQLRSGVISPDEWRRGERMNPRPDGAGGEFMSPGATAAVPTEAQKPEPTRNATGGRAHAA